MKQWQLLMITFVLALVSAAGGYQLQQYLKKENTKQVHKETVYEAPVTPEDVVGTEIKNFSLLDVDAKQRNLSEWQGKVIVLNFWATWCSPCREEIPVFVELQEQYADDGLQFVGIALQEADEIRDFLKEFKVNYPALAGIEDVIKIAKQLGNDIGALPYTVIVDREGSIVFTRRGPLLKSEAKNAILPLL